MSDCVIIGHWYKEKSEASYYWVNMTVLHIVIWYVILLRTDRKWKCCYIVLSDIVLLLTPFLTCNSGVPQSGMQDLLTPLILMSPSSRTPDSNDRLISKLCRKKPDNDVDHLNRVCVQLIHHPPIALPRICIHTQEKEEKQLILCWSSSMYMQDMGQMFKEHTLHAESWSCR